MRLTLRTLLAYLDDILEPAQTNEIGSKLAESSFAKLLSNRIRDVMRRRRLGAPALGETVEGIDANAVAEYLDNTLPAERVADIEKVCLESDTYLAEAGACHQILTLVLGEPVEIRHESRERMYALKPAVDAPVTPAGEATQVLPDAKTASPKSDATATAKPRRAARRRVAPAESTKSAVKIPDYLAHKPVWKRAMLMVLVLGVLGVWLAVIVKDQGLPFWSSPTTPVSQLADQPGKKGAPSAQEIALEAAKNKGDAPADATGEKATTPAAEGADAAPSVGPDGNAATTADSSPAAGVPADPQPPPDEDENAPDAKSPPAVASKADAGDGTKEAAVPPPKPPEPGLNDAKKVAAAEPKPADANKTAPASPPAAQETILYTSPDGLLLHYNETAAIPGWYLVPHRSEVFFNERLACPEPFEATLQIKNTSCRLVLVGGASVRVTPGDGKSTFGIEIREGRVALARADSAEAASKDPVVVGVAVNGEHWLVALTEPATLCGIEIVPEQPDEYEKPPATNAYQGLLSVAKGAVNFDDGKGVVRALPERGRQSLTPGDRAKEAEAQAPVEVKLADVPRWLDFDAEPTVQPMARSIRTFEDGFNLNDVLDDSIPALYEDRQPKVAELAVKTLALTENHALMVRALENTDHEEARLAAINGLRNWLGRDPNNGALLKEDLAAVYRDDDIQTVYELLWGFKKESAYDLPTSLKLVDLLKHNQLVVRELAFYHVYRMTGRKGEYRPHLSPQQINVIATRMRRDVERDKGLLRRP